MNKMTTVNTDKGQSTTEADSQGHCALGDGSPLLHAWAEECGIDVNDNRVIYGWPEKFRCFKNGWEAALKISVAREDMRAAMTALSLEKDDKIDALRTELTATCIVCEDWIKIANAGANDTARLNWMSERGRIDYAVSYWVPGDTQSLREKIDEAMGFLANLKGEPRP